MPEGAACPSWARLGAEGAGRDTTHQTICLGGERMLLVNSQSFSCGGREGCQGDGGTGMGGISSGGSQGHS